MRRRLALAALPAALLLGAACFVETDRELYAAGDAGVATFHNGAEVTAWLPGCSAYHLEKRTRDGYEDRGPGVVCIWEGFAEPVEPGAARRFDFRVPDEAGTWRLRFFAGLGCDASQPLTPFACDRLGTFDSAPFEVTPLCEPAACGPALGMPNVLCDDGVSVGGPSGRCLAGADGCGWEILACPAP